MNKEISFSQYRGIDLTILTILTVGAEAIVALAASKWFTNELYSLSPMVALVCIVMMRWGAWATIPAMLSGVAFCAVMGQSWEHFLVYCVGNCGALAAMVWFKAMGKEAVRKRIEVTILFTITAFVGTIVGRWAVSLLLGYELSSIVDFFLADSLSLLFAVVVILIARRIDGLFEDQRSYLIRLEEERQKERDNEADYYD